MAEQSASFQINSEGGKEGINGALKVHSHICCAAVCRV